MPTLKLTLLLEQDGQPVPGFQLVRNLTVQQSIPFDIVKPSIAGFFSIPPQFAVLQVALIRALTESISVRLNGQTTSSIDLNPGGLVLVFDGFLQAGLATNATILNISGNPTEVQGLGAGST